MRLADSKWMISVIMLFYFCARTSAQNTDIGRMEYQASCAPCHGVDAKGSGPVSKQLKTRPSDLTVLAKKNNGVFPARSVHEIIDGRNLVASHGPREMPIWGYRFVPSEHYDLKPSDDYIYSPPISHEEVVQARIRAVVDYLNRIQEK